MGWNNISSININPIYIFNHVNPIYSHDINQFYHPKQVIWSQVLRSGNVLLVPCHWIPESQSLHPRNATQRTSNGCGTFWGTSDPKSQRGQRRPGVTTTVVSPGEKWWLFGHDFMRFSEWSVDLEHSVGKHGSISLSHLNRKQCITAPSFSALHRLVISPSLDWNYMILHIHSTESNNTIQFTRITTANNRDLHRGLWNWVYLYDWDDLNWSPSHGWAPRTPSWWISRHKWLPWSTRNRKWFRPSWAFIRRIWWRGWRSRRSGHELRLFHRLKRKSWLLSTQIIQGSDRIRGFPRTWTP